VKLGRMKGYEVAEHSRFSACPIEPTLRVLPRARPLATTRLQFQSLQSRVNKRPGTLERGLHAATMLCTP